MSTDARQIEEFRSAPQDEDRLAFRGGLVFSGERALDGLSGIIADGADVLMVSDFGHWVGGRMVIDGGRLTGLTDLWRAPMVRPGGEIAAGKSDGDAEALARRGDEIVVALERSGEVLSFAKAPGALEPSGAAPVRLIHLRAQLGPQHARPEAALVDARGEVVVINEVPSHRDGARGVRLPADRFAVRLADPWRVTGADLAPGGDAFIVERRYEGGIDVGMRVRRIGRETMARNLWDGPVLLEADFSDQIDNMEGVAVTVDDDEIALTIISDNNASFLQRRLMLRFVVSDPLPRPNPSR